jgi:hypothetical protein
MAVTLNASTSAGLVQSADTSGILQLQSNGTTIQTIDSTGSYGQLRSATAVASTSGTSIDFTGIPSWVKRITVMFSGVSTSGTSSIQVQIGSGSVTTSGYASTGTVYGGLNTTTGSTISSGFILATTTAADSDSGIATLVLITGNTWVLSSNVSKTVGNYLYAAAGTIALGGVLDRVRITTVNGTDTFDAGSINILYEG